MPHSKRDYYLKASHQYYRDKLFKDLSRCVNSDHVLSDKEKLFVVKLVASKLKE